jgi:ribose 5-phosphate isomerase A
VIKSVFYSPLFDTKNMRHFHICACNFDTTALRENDILRKGYNNRMPAPFSADDLKRQAALRALDFVEEGMRLGLGTGSTAAHFVDALGERVKEGLNIICVPTSIATFEQATRLGIPLTTLDEHPVLDLTVDGTDEIDPHMRLIKGGGGAHLREKIVAYASKRLLIIADESKAVESLGRFPLPIEVVSFGLGATRLAIERAIKSTGCEGTLTLRQGKDKKLFITDSGNVVLDAALGNIPDPEGLASALSAIPGVVEHGLFLGVAKIAIIATSKGIVETGKL